MLQSKKKITGKAVLIFLICLTSVEGFIERSRQNGGEATAGETRALQNQRSDYGDLKPSNNGQERRISQHIYDKRSFRTGSIAFRDTRTEGLLTTTEENIREFRLQKERTSAQPTYRLLSSRNHQTRTAPSEDDAIRTRISETEQRRSNNVERASSRIQLFDTSRRYSETPRTHFPRKDNSRNARDRSEDATRTRVSRIADEEKRISSRNSIGLNRDRLDGSRTNDRDTSSTQNMEKSRSFQQPNRRISDSRAPEGRETPEREDVRSSRSSRKLGTIREDSRESQTQIRQPIERTDSGFRDHMRSSTVQRATQRRSTDNIIELSRNRRSPERRSADYSDRRILESGARARQSMSTSDGRDRRSIEVVDERRSSAVRIINNIDRGQYLENNERNIDVTNANQIEERSRSLLGVQTRRYQPAEERNREIDTRRTNPENVNTNQIPHSSRKIDNRTRNTRVSSEERFALRDQEITRRHVPLSNDAMPFSSRRVQLPISRVYRELEDNRFRDSMRQGRQSRLSMDLTERRLSSRDITNDILQGRDSGIESYRQRQPLHLDRSSLQRVNTLEDARLYREAPEDLMRQSKGSRINNVVERRSSEQNQSLKESRMSDENREDASRYSRQGRDSRMQETGLNFADRRDAPRTLSLEDTKFSRDVREDRLTDTRLTRDSRVVDARVSREERAMGSGQRADSRQNSLSDRSSRLLEDIRSSRIAREDFRDSRQDRDSIIDVSKPNGEARLLDRRHAQRSLPSESTRMSTESHEDHSRETRRILGQNEDRRNSQRSLELSDYTRKLMINPEAITDDRFNTRTVRQNFENHFRKTRSSRYSENDSRYRHNDRITHGDEQMRRSERQYSQRIQSDERRAISSGSDSPRRENKIAHNNFMTELNNTATTLGLGEPLQQNDGEEANLGVWVEALKLALAVFLLGQIFVGSSEKYKLRIKNVISTLRSKKEKVQ